MRILVFVHEFPPIGGGGGRVAYDICKALVERGHQVTLLTAHMRGLPREEIVDGIRLIRLPSLRTETYRAGLLAMSAYVLAGFWAGLRYIRKSRPDIMHAHFGVPAGIATWALSLLTGVPYILTSHLGDVPGGVPEKTDKWFRWLFPLTPLIWCRAKRVIAVSQHTRQLILKRYPVEVTVIPNGVDLKTESPSEVVSHRPPRIIFAGRFMPQKNPLVIVRTLNALKDLNWECHMLGDGPLFEDVKAEIEHTGLQKRFTLPGWVTPEEVLTRLAESDILFMPSLSEGQPVAAVQALSKGLAIVASKIGGFMDLVDDGHNGYLVEGRDQAGFSQALRALLADPELLLNFRQAGLEKASTFGIHSVAEQYEKILMDVVHAR